MHQAVGWGFALWWFAKCKAYSKAGADIIFPEAVTTEKEMRQVCNSIGKPAMANMADGGNTPILSAEELADIGFAFAIFPATALLSAAAAIKHPLTRLKIPGTSIYDNAK